MNQNARTIRSKAKIFLKEKTGFSYARDGSVRNSDKVVVFVEFKEVKRSSLVIKVLFTKIGGRKSSSTDCSKVNTLVGFMVS